MIPQKMANVELAKVEAEIARWELQFARMRNRVKYLPANSPDLELSKQILLTFEVALKAFYKRRNRLLER
jgi:hypothetical protein